jgi:hypothetical protein
VGLSAASCQGSRNTERRRRRGRRATSSTAGAGLGDDDTRLLWLLIEAKTNREIAATHDASQAACALPVGDDQHLLGEAAVLAFRERMV